MAGVSSRPVSAVEQGWGKPTADRSVEGHPIMLGGRVFEHGLGTHSPGVFLIDLDGGSRRFTAWTGIDDETGEAAAALSFRVVGGRQTAFAIRAGLCAAERPARKHVWISDRI